MVTSSRPEASFEGMLRQAKDLHEAGRFPEEERLYREILQTQARHPQAHHNLGLLAFQAGHRAAGLTHLKTALETNPMVGQYWLSYAHGLLVAGHGRDALQVIQTAIQRGFRSPAAESIRQNAELAMQQETAGRQDPAPIVCDQLEALLTAGRHADLESRAQSLTIHHPQSGFVWSMLGIAHLLRGKHAVPALQRAAELLPDDAQVRNNLGNALQRSGDLSAAVQSLQCAVRIQPGFAEAHNNLGGVLRALGHFNDAATSYRRALALRPDFAEAHNNLGSVLRDLGELDEAVSSFGRALALRPKHASAHNNLGSAFMDLGRFGEAIASFRRAVEIKPDFFEAHSNLLFAHNLLPNASPEAAFEEAKRFGALAAGTVTTRAAPDHNLDPTRCLRIGLVSGDLCAHPVGYFLENTLKYLPSADSRRIEVVAYSNHTRSDALSERLKAFCHGWRLVVGLSDQDLAQQIRADRIDILIDLAGHTAHNRLPLFAHRPAPVQATWLGYFATTGLDAIDYLIADPWSMSQARERDFTEKIWRLPETRLCFSPPDVELAVSALPAMGNGHVTFGCFNNLSKINDGVVALWASILAAVPGSRLFLKAKQLRQESVRASMVERFAAHGIGADQLILEGSEARAVYLQAYGRVDIALDPFPYPGGTTTAEALWMGVPVLTLAGDRLLSRQGLGLLMNAGLAQWVADDAGDYLARAVAYSKDLGALSSLRGGLRAKVLASPIFDGQRFSRHLAAALHGMWERYCAGQRAADASAAGDTRGQ